jgi:uncharacterized protein (TIGR00297 family)
MLQLFTDPVVSGLIVMSIIGVLAYKLGFVDITGLISAFVVGFTVWYTGGYALFTILLFFFIGAGFATKYKYKAKKRKGLAQESKGKRSWRNVFGSGIIPMIFSIGIFISQYPSLNIITQYPDLPFLLFGGFVGAVGTTTADTLASEIGVFSKRKPRLITNLRRKVPAGTIGAVSLLGEAVAIASGLIIGLIATIFALLDPLSIPSVYNHSWHIWAIIPLSILTAFMGCNLDSLIGVIAQDKYECEICGAITDKKIHCGREGKYLGGIGSISNSQVNLGSSGMGAVLGIILGTGLFLIILGVLFTWLAASSKS